MNRAKKLIVAAEATRRKCPLTRKPCLAWDCALWEDRGLRDIYSRAHHGVYAVGLCKLCRRP